MKKNNLFTLGISILTMIGIVSCAPTSEPTTAPTTSEPTTSEPTTSEPTTSEPSTSIPTVSDPTQPEIETGVINEDMPQGTHYSIGDRVYNFSFKGIDGWDYDLESAVNSKLLVVINFFASWCTPCKQEFPAIEEAYREYSDTVEVFALSTEPTDTNANLKTNFVNRYNLTFPMGIDASMDIVFPYLTERQVQGIDGFYIPYTVSIDRYGRIVEKIEGSEPNANAWKTKFDKYIADDYSY